MTAQQIRDELTDRQALALTVFGECRREPLAGWYAVAWVVRNRLLTPKRFGYSFKGVCHRPAQFSCWWPGGGVQNYAAAIQARRFRRDDGFVVQHAHGVGENLLRVQFGLAVGRRGKGQR